MSTSPSSVKKCGFMKDPFMTFLLLLVTSVVYSTCYVRYSPISLLLSQHLVSHWKPLKRCTLRKLAMDKVYSNQDLMLMKTCHPITRELMLNPQSWNIIFLTWHSAGPFNSVASDSSAFQNVAYLTTANIWLNCSRKERSILNKTFVSMKSLTRFINKKLSEESSLATKISSGILNMIFFVPLVLMMTKMVITLVLRLERLKDTWILHSWQSSNRSSVNLLTLLLLKLI